MPPEFVAQAITIRTDLKLRPLPLSLFTMKILVLCTAHNSLSQRLYLVLSRFHHVTIEYALSDAVMISAVALVSPDLIICPFLTRSVPREVHEKVLTLVIHRTSPSAHGRFGVY
jgi:hypothetical protein